MQPLLLRPPPILAFDKIADEQLWSDGNTGEITAQRAVSQLISCSSEGLHRVEVFLDRHYHYVNSALWLKIYPGDVTSLTTLPRPVRVVGPLIAETLSRDGWFAFEFEPIRANAGVYTLRFVAPDAARGDAVSLRLCTTRGVGLSIGGVRRPHGALLFRALCLRTGADALLENFQRFRRSVFELPFSVDYQPLMARLEMSRPCDLGCVMCTRGLQPFRASEGPPFLTMERFNTLEPLLPKFLWITAFGLGEPFLNPEIIPILRKVRSFNPFAHVFISSNGNRLSEEAIETVVAERLISDFQISIDGADAATFENIRPRAQYSHVLRSLERLLRAREKYGYTEMTIKVGSLVMRSTASQVYPYIKQMAALGVDRIVFVTPGGVQCDQLRLPDSETWAQVYEQLLQGHSEIAGSSTIIDGPFLHEIAEWHRTAGRKDRVPEWSIGACAAKIDQVNKRTTPCTIPWESLSLRADGSFGLCCNTNRPMGGPEDGSLLEPWMRGQHYQGVRTELVGQKYHRDCKVCLAGGLVAPDIITPPTYTSACLYPGDNDSNLAEIIGRDIRIEPLVTTGQTGVIVELPDRPFDENEESSSADVGRWKLSGWLHQSETDRPVALLGIAIDGIIREIVPGPSARTGGRWSTWIDGGGAPPDAEKVEIFGVAQDPSGPQLTRFRRLAPSGSDPSASRPDLNGRSNDAFPPPGSATGVFGWIEGAEISDGVVTLRGWASDLRLQRAVSRVILLVNGQVIRAVKPWLRRLDVARVHGPAHEISGFRIDFPLTRKKSTQPLQIVAIAVDAEGATSGELHWPENPSLLAVAMDAVRDNRVVAAVAIERARGWCLHTAVDENESVVSRNRLQRLGFNRWLVPRRKTSELTGWVDAVERVDDMILVRGVALEASGRRPASSVEFFVGQRRLGRTSAGIWQGVTPSGIAGYGAFTAVLPALGLGDNPRATLQVSAVSRAGRTYRLPWTEQGALTAPHEPVDAPAIR